MMNQHSLGSGSLSPGDLPLKRKRGRPRKDDSHVQGENSPVTPVSDSGKKDKPTTAATDPAVDLLVGQVVSGVIEGSFDAGFLLNVKVGGSDTNLKGVVFLPGRCTPINAANDVAPNVKMYKRKDIPIPFQNPQTNRRDFVPPSQQINKQATEVKIDGPKFPDRILPSELQSGIPITVKNQSASVILPLGVELPRIETGLALGETVPLQKLSDSGKESQAAAFMAQLLHDKAVEKDEVQQATNMEIEEAKESEPASAPLVVVEKDEVQQGTNMEIEETNESELASAPLVDITPSTGYINLEPRVENQVSSSDLKPNELVHSEVKDLNSMEIEETQESAASAPLVDITPSTRNINQEPQVEIQVLSSDLKSNELVHSEVKDLNKNEERKTALTAEPESMLFESVGIGRLMEKPKLEHSQNPLFAAPESTPSEAIGISMMMEKPSPEDDRIPLVTEPESMSPEPTGINFLVDDKQNSLKKDTQHMPSEPVGISTLMEQPQLEQNQAPLFAAPESIPSEPIGISMLMEKPNIEDDRTPLFVEPESMSPGSIVINFLADKQHFPEKDTHNMPSEPAGISILMEKPQLEHNQTPLFAAPESTPSEPIGNSMLMEKPNLEEDRTLLFAEPESMSPEPVGINFLVDKQNSSMKYTQDMPSEPAGISALMEKPKLEHNQLPLFAALDSLPSGPIGISMLMEKPDLEDGRTSLFAEPEPISREPIGINFLVDKQNSSKKDTQDMLSEQVGISMLMEKSKREHNQTLLFDALPSMSSDPIGINMLMEKPNLEDDRTPLFAEPKSTSPEPIGINFLLDRENSPEKYTRDMPSEPANRSLFGDDTSNITAGGSYSVPMTSLSVMLFEGEAVPSQPTSLANEGSTLPRMIDTQICSNSSGATNNGDSGIRDGITATTHLELSSGLNLSGSGSLKNSRQEQN